MANGGRGKAIFDQRVEYPLPVVQGVRDYVFYCVPAGDGYGKGAHRPSSDVPHFWHPYRIDDSVNGRRRLIQCRLADLSGVPPPPQPSAPPQPTPAPRSDLLHDPASGGRHPVHQIEPAAIPTDGLQLERRYMLARATDGQPILWTQRRRLPLVAPPTMRLAFDLLERT